MSDKKELISNFKSITNASDQESEFYLESHGWDLESATMSYFESQSGAPPPVQQQTAPRQQPQTTAQSQPQQQQAYSSEPFRQVGTVGGGSGSTPSSSSSGGSKPAASKPSAGRGAIRSLSDYNQEEENDDEDEDDDKTQRYFTGGEKSGLMVESAPKQKKGDDNKMVEKVFESAKKQGATPEPEAAKPKPQPAFEGSGYVLGNTNAGGAKVESPKEKKDSEQQMEVKITFWQQGFTLDDGPLRRFDDPQNREFLEAINRGVVPKELEAKAPQHQYQLQIVLVDNRKQEYVEPPKPKYVAFSGGGQALGSGSSSTSTTTTTTSSSSSTASTQPASGANMNIDIDKTKPTTVVQIRLADGTRHQVTFNETHTLSTLINYINSINGNTRAFDLLSGYPQRPINLDPNQTLKDANLLGAQVTQKFK
ncbi:hypothetical protein SAMD00019534_019580, partial [Acytostelium subglobosum LB1]|uniref:hypothetical protein n=1 Tax=Acytostelium subglobosum LB1 TaxID=1410327 RepID=UPI000645009F